MKESLEEEPLPFTTTETSNLDPVDRDGHNNQLQVLKQDVVLCSFFSINHQTVLAKQVNTHCPVYLGENGYEGILILSFS